MATKPTAWQEQGPVDSLDIFQGEGRKNISRISRLHHKKAPKAMPEEDIDVPEPKADVRAPHETIKTIKMIDATEMKNQESPGISQHNPRETQGVVTELEQVYKKLSRGLPTQKEPEEPIDPGEDDFPPPPSFSALSMKQYYEKEGFPSLEGEVAEWIRDIEVISDPTDSLTSFDSQKSQEHPKKPQLVSGSNIRAEGNVDGIRTRKKENNVSQPAQHSPFDRKYSDDGKTVNSLPFADESEEEEEVGINVMSCQQQLNTHDMRCKAVKPSRSVDRETHSVLDASPSVRHGEELLLQSQCDLAPRGVNQEAAQQVFCRRSPPVSTVATELSNQGGTTSQGCGYVVAGRDRCGRVGERTEGENEQTGGEKGQTESRPEKNNPAGRPHSGGLLTYSQTVRTQELKTGKYSCGVTPIQSRQTTMESDMFDDSQSDSGVSADFSPCSTLEGTTTSTGSLGTFSTETPIEKEIRRAIEREHSLRRSRGLPNLPASPEYAEIPLRKTVLSQSLTSKSEWSQDKDRDFAGKKMLHEIHKEARREQDLLKIGKIPGSYDKGTAPQIKEKKQLFEAFQTPSNATYSISAKSKTASWSSDSSSSSSNSTLENQEEITSQRPTLGDSRVYGSHGIDLLKPTHSQDFPKGGLTNSTLRGPGSSEGTGCQLIILESNPSVPAQMRHHVKAETEAIAHSEGPSNSAYRAREHGGLTGREQEEKEDVASKENPFYKLRPSTNLVKVKQDILVAQEREKELRSQRISLYGGIQAGEGGGVQLISLEGKSPSSSSSKERLDMPDMPGSTSKGGTGPSAGRQSFGKLCMWPPAQGEEERTHRSEVLQGPRTPRQKTPLVQRWESGLIDGYNLEDD